mgnify:CR=1 FL=1
MFQRQFSLQILLTEQENKISNTIHPTAIIDKTSFIGKNVRIGPYSIIEKNVKIDDECIIGNNVTICANTELGKNCKVYHSSSIGEIPQDLKFSGEETKTIVGDGTTIREYVTVNRGTKALGQTKIGAGCLLMASSHVAHDCILGDNIIMSNLCTLGGHVELGDWVVLGGGVLVHQFTKIGSHAFVGGGFRVVKDIPPFILAAGEPLKFKGLNSVGLKRRGINSENIQQLKTIYKIYFRSGKNRSESLKEIETNIIMSDVKNQVVDFISLSNRGII